MDKIALSIPGFGKIDVGLPKGVPTGGFDTLNKIVSVLIEFALIAALGFALYTIAHAAFNMITSGGDKERFAQGRERLRFAIIGLIVIFLSFLILNFFGKLFGVPLLTRTCNSGSGIYCAGSCYPNDWIAKTFPCGASCITKKGVPGLYPDTCLNPTPTPIPCIDTDPDNLTTIAGTCTDSTGPLPFNDYCFDSKSVTQFQCSSPTGICVSGGAVNCAPGLTCVNGACVIAP